MVVKPLPVQHVPPIQAAVEAACQAVVKLGSGLSGHSGVMLLHELLSFLHSVVSLSR